MMTEEIPPYAWIIAVTEATTLVILIVVIFDRLRRKHLQGKRYVTFKTYPPHIILLHLLAAVICGIAASIVIYPILIVWLAYQCLRQSGECLVIYWCVDEPEVAPVLQV